MVVKPNHLIGGRAARRRLRLEVRKLRAPRGSAAP